MEEIRNFLSAPEWQGIRGILAIAIPVIATIWAAIKYQLISSIKKNKVIFGIVILYFLSGYLIIYSSQTAWILWWFILMISIYVINQLISYPELFLKGFQDDFRNGLKGQNWEHYGDWRVMEEQNSHILQVSNSDAGGISAHCKTWTNYIVSFDTKIIKHNSSWIIRATDVFSYVMLQCEPDKLRVHYRLQGNWVVIEVVALPFTIELREWFHVEIDVRGIKLMTKITYQDKVYTVLDSNVLEPRVLPIIPIYNDQGVTIAKLNWACSYPYGSVGFRQFGDEIAHFTNVKVFKI